MGVYANARGLSTLVLILLIVISAIIGGIVSYAFTIAYYTSIPGETTLAIIGVHINPNNVRVFNVTLLNPSYSPGNAKITRIAVSVKNGTQLYDVIEMTPPIGAGLEIRSGETINITCSKIKKDNANMTFGEFASIFAGEKIHVHVFAEESSAANMEVRLPLVKLEIAADFNPRISFKRFNITITNSIQSQVNLTITDVVPGSIEFEGVHPDFRVNPKVLSIGETVCFQFNGSWHGHTYVMIDVETEQGYVFHKEVKVGTVQAVIQSVSFNENNTNHFNVTVCNLAESANPVNVRNIKCVLENGTELTFDCASAEIAPNTTKLFTLNWNWKEYRGKNVTVVAYFTQDFNTQGYRASTPPPIIVRVLNAEGAFSLKYKEHFNLTVLNHAFSLEAVNITKIVAKKTGEILPVAGLVLDPGSNKTFSCNFAWTRFLYDYGRNLTLTLHTVAVQTLKEYTFDFSLTLPVAELNITPISHVTIGETGYLNLTIKNLEYSVWNLTLSKIVVKTQDSATPLEYILPKKHVKVNVGSEIVLLCPFDWQRYLGKSITLAVITEELVEAWTTYTID
ncbi:MAG: hypothetical protein QXZ68_05700 [Candidatus Bathyarchaeia archaeon]